MEDNTQMNTEEQEIKETSAVEEAPEVEAKNEAQAENVAETPTPKKSSSKNMGIGIVAVVLVCVLGFFGYKYFANKGKTIEIDDFTITTNIDFGEPQADAKSEYEKAYSIKNPEGDFIVIFGSTSFDDKNISQSGFRGVVTAMLAETKEPNPTFYLDNDYAAVSFTHNNSKSFGYKVSGIDDKTHFSVIVAGPLEKKEEVLKLADTVTYKGKQLSSYKTATKEDLKARSQELFAQYESEKK